MSGPNNPTGSSHFDASGAARMVDIAAKEAGKRVATAKGAVIMAPATAAKIAQGSLAKGDVLGIARIAGIMAAKRTPELIPLCHPLPLASVEIDFATDPEKGWVEITATCGLVGHTGVEMEALTAVSVAALTIYDMCKSIDRAMRIGDIRLTHKSGGKSGIYTAD